MNLIRNESTNDRLLALEKQMKILSASCDQSGSPSNHDKTSELITDPVVLARKTAESLEKKPCFLKGENHFIMRILIVLELPFICFFGCIHIL